MCLEKIDRRWLVFRNGIGGGLNMDISIEITQACFITESVWEWETIYLIWVWVCNLYIMEVRQFIRSPCVGRMLILELTVIWPLREMESHRDIFEVINTFSRKISFSDLFHLKLMQILYYFSQLFTDTNTDRQTYQYIKVHRHIFAGIQYPSQFRHLTPLK